MRPACTLAALPPIDIVLLSHNHYDHLDTPTLRRISLAHQGATWVVPLRLAEIVRRCGASRVIELDWWQEAQIGDLVVGCAPAQHFSGRGLHDRDRTLWCSWSLRTPSSSFYFGADSGLHPDYGAIGNRFGPFDIIALPIGAYEPRWFMRPVHMSPEDAVQVYRDLLLVGAQPPAMVPIHWGTFRLSDEPMDEPPLRIRRAWEAAGFPSGDLWLLAHGETRER